MSDAARVFAYGSLMRGLKYSALLSDAVFCGAAETRDPYELYDLGPYPAASPGGQAVLQGEVYELDEATLERVDVLEGHPHLYRRRERPLGDGTSAWIYEIVIDEGTRERLRRAPRVDSGDWRRWLELRPPT